MSYGSSEPVELLDEGGFHVPLRFHLHTFHKFADVAERNSVSEPIRRFFEISDILVLLSNCGPDQLPRQVGLEFRYVR